MERFLDPITNVIWSIDEIKRLRQIYCADHSLVDLPTFLDRIISFEVPDYEDKN